MHLPEVGGSGWESRRRDSALDCRTVRQRRLTSSFRLVSLARKLPTLSCTAALLPKHRFPVASSRAHPQLASSALKSGLSPADSPASAPGQASADTPAPPGHDGLGHYPKLPEAAPSAAGATGPKRLPRFPLLRFPPGPSIPPLPSPDTPPNSSWLSRHTAGLLEFTRKTGGLALPAAPTGPATPHRHGIGTASARKWASSAKHILAPLPTASSRRAAYAATQASRFSSSAFSSRFWGRLKANPKRRR